MSWLWRNITAPEGHHPTIPVGFHPLSCKHRSSPLIVSCRIPFVMKPNAVANCPVPQSSWYSFACDFLHNFQLLESAPPVLLPPLSGPLNYSPWQTIPKRWDWGFSSFLFCVSIALWVLFPHFDCKISVKIVLLPDLVRRCGGGFHRFPSFF